MYQPQNGSIWVTHTHTDTPVSPSLSPDVGAPRVWRCKPPLLSGTAQDDRHRHPRDLEWTNLPRASFGRGDRIAHGVAFRAMVAAEA
jgi:hypothetical protein